MRKAHTMRTRSRAVHLVGVMRKAHTMRTDSRAVHLVGVMRKAHTMRTDSRAVPSGWSNEKGSHYEDRK
ncbi:hypothetical protein DPMN_069685 [Dreissena polymorpha]|uniref:Uncharacterized protein n=1 Tax=Dreissena polymorpha TaxID=45954 RepID=A0A9D3Z1Y2_DREPO|nr:hypothetical protein DPMN_069685 [Dreissena polymorpha]